MIHVLPDLRRARAFERLVLAAETGPKEEGST